MALLDPRGVFRRCPECETAIAEDAQVCPACGAEIVSRNAPKSSFKPGAGPRANRDTARTGPESGEDAPAARPAAPRAVLGDAGAGFIRYLGLGKGTSGIASGIESFAEQIVHAFGVVAVTLLGMKMGEAALEENPFATGEPGAGHLLKRRIYRLTIGLRTELSEKDRIALYRDLAKFSDAGVGFHDALARLQKAAKKPVLARVLADVRGRLLDGETLGDAFGRHAYLFEPLDLALIEVGESLGTLGDNMRLLVETLEERRELRRQLARKFVQPIGLIFIANYILTIPILYAGGIFSYLMTVAAPTLVILFAAITLIVILPVLVMAAGRDVMDRILIELPAFGSIARANALARFSRALGAAIGAGVEVGKGLTISARAADNVIVARAIADSLPHVQEHGLAEGLRLGGVLPADIADELANGEATGTVAPTLERISRDARQKAARSVAVLGGILSFALIAFSALYAVYSVFTKAVFGARPFIMKDLIPAITPPRFPRSL